MATYNDLKPGSYYLIRENENASIEMVFIPMETGKCILVEYQDEEQSMNWYKKTENVFELIEQLTKEEAEKYESMFESGEEDDLAWPEDDDQDSGWFTDDNDEDDKIRALNN
jgi:hypothetical protein